MRIAWYTTIYTDNVLKHDRPDITLVHKDKKEWALLDVAITADWNIIIRRKGEGGKVPGNSI